MTKLVFTIVLCLVIESCCSQHMPYRRMKRGKYYASPPQRFYSRPPYSPPVSGVFSYTPPPMYREDEQSYPGTRPKVSKPPASTKEGLGDEDLLNLIKYLTRQDLDRLIEYAKAKNKEYEYDLNGFKPSASKYNEHKTIENDFKELSNLSSATYNEYKPNGNDFTELNGPSSGKYNENKPNSNDFRDLNRPDSSKYNEYKQTDNDYIESSNSFEKNIERNHYKPEQEVIEDSFQKYSNEYNRVFHEKEDNFRPLLSEPEYKTQNSNYNYVTEQISSKFYKTSTPRYQEHSSPNFSSINNYHNQYQDQNQRYKESNNYKYGNNNPISNSGNNDEYTNDNIYPPLDIQETKNKADYRNIYSDAPKYDKFRFKSSQQYPPDNEYQNEFVSKNTGENVPKSKSLRDDTEYELSYTNKIPAVAKVETSTYRVENFGDLPLMEYNSKLASSDSYNVPHYTVVSKSTFSAPSPSTLASSSSSQLLSSSSSSYGPSPLIETAPPISAARLQSDAHLKATRIWTSKSKGTAYTLHDDGTLSLERPLKLRSGYGF